MYQICRQLASPVGVIWLGLFLLAWLAWRSQKRGLLVGNVAVLITYTLLGNYWVACQFSQANQTQFEDVDPWVERQYDVVCVLGGAVSISSHGHEYLNRGGDRVMLGARLYFCGRTSRLIATGTSRNESDPDPSDTCWRIWRDLQIPDASITKVGGLDTTQELEQIQQVCKAEGWTQIGLVTSVDHMPRVMAYAEEIGLRLHPLPSGSPTPKRTWDVRKHLIPEARGFLMNQYTAYEFVGALIQ